MNPRSQRGSVLIIVMWICLGLVALTIYFAYAVNSELQSAANRVGEIEARQAVEGAVRYAAYVLNNRGVDGVVPNSGIAPQPTKDYYSAAVPVGDQPGDPQFWFIGRDPNYTTAGVSAGPVFGLVDESSKLNLNTATAAMLQNLPLANMTPDVASAIVSWRTQASSRSGASAVDNLYSTLDPPRSNKGAPFESTEELRLVYGVTLDLLLGEDTNRNGVVDPNEDDGDKSPPRDNQDGQLQPGLLEYLTAFSLQPTTTTTGTARVNVASAAGRGGLQALMTGKGMSQADARACLRNLGNQACTSVADFMVKSRISAADFALIHTSITSGTTAQGYVNVNTAGAAVLAAIPGVGPDNATSMVNYRTSNPTDLTTFAWLSKIFSAGAISRIGPYITDQSYQFSADIAAVGRNGRGYCREKVVFDTSAGIPRVVYRQDFGAYGWALGRQVRQSLKTGGTY